MLQHKGIAGEIVWTAALAVFRRLVRTGRLVARRMDIAVPSENEVILYRSWKTS